MQEERQMELMLTELSDPRHKVTSIIIRILIIGTDLLKLCYETSTVQQQYYTYIYDYSYTQINMLFIEILKICNAKQHYVNYFETNIQNMTEDKILSYITDFKKECNIKQRYNSNSDTAIGLMTMLFDLTFLLKSIQQYRKKNKHKRHIYRDATDIIKNISKNIKLYEIHSYIIQSTMLFKSVLNNIFDPDICLSNSHE